MGERARKNFFIRIIFNKILITILGLIIIIVISLPLAKNLSKRYKTNQEIKEIENEIANLESKNNQIKKLVNYFQSDNFVEEQAKLSLNMRKEGEQVVVIKDRTETAADLKSTNNKNNSNAALVGGIDTQKEINPLKWLRYFLDR